MSEQDLIQAAHGLVDAFNTSDWEAFKAGITPDSLYDEVGTSRRLEGSESIVQGMQGWRKAMPDVQGTVNNAFGADNTVVLEVTWKGTHTGPLQGPTGTIEATGRQQTTRSGWIMHFDGGKLRESRHYFDMLSFMQQLGVLSRGASA